MATPYVTGPALIYVGLPSTLLRALPVFPRPANSTTTLQGGGVGIPRPPAAAGRLDNRPGGGRLVNTPSRVTEFIVLLLRSITPVFLGTCEETPQIDFDPAYQSYFRDEMGRSHPAERIYEGEEGTIVADLTRYNEFVYSFLAAKAAGSSLNLPTAPRGIDLDGYIGTLMGAEGGALPLWVHFPYAAKPFFLARGMPAGYRFFAALLLDEGLGPLDTRPRKVRLVWRAQRLLDPRSGTVFLYDHDMRGLPPIN